MVMDIYGFWFCIRFTTDSLHDLQLKKILIMKVFYMDKIYRMFKIFVRVKQTLHLSTLKLEETAQSI